MTKIDEFESLFKSAAKTRFHLESIELTNGLLVTDLDATGADALAEKLRSYLGAVGDLNWKIVGKDAYPTVGALLELVESESPDLICTYRNLGTDAWRYRYSLGVHLEVLTQATSIPVLVLPNPHADRGGGHRLERTATVMVVTDHITGDDNLVSYAVKFTQDKGTLLLTHVEDQRWFDHYVDVISKLPEIDTDMAREAIEEHLLKEPGDYIASVEADLAAVPIDIESIVLMGPELPAYRRIVDEHAVDLLVLDTKDDEQLAMHGLAHSLAIELANVPMLML